MLAPHDAAAWHAHLTLEKFHADRATFDSEAAFRAAGDPFEVLELDGNLLVNSGIGLLLDLLIGAGGASYANANAYLGVGDSATAAAAAQTDLQAGPNKLRKAVDATYPQRAGQTVSWRATFAASDANFVWNEWGIFNAAAAGIMLNRKAEALGTKTGGSWILTVTVTIS